MERATMNHRILWSNIEACLDLGPVRWRERIEELGQVRAVKDRSAGRIWSDDEIFRGVLLAVLSSNTVWSKVERIQADLSELFCDFSLEAYASHSDTEIDSRFVPWFKDRKAGSVPLRGGLVNLIRAARILLQYSKCHGAAGSSGRMRAGSGTPSRSRQSAASGSTKMALRGRDGSRLAAKRPRPAVWPIAVQPLARKQAPSWQEGSTKVSSSRGSKP